MLHITRHVTGRLLAVLTLTVVAACSEGPTNLLSSPLLTQRESGSPAPLPHAATLVVDLANCSNLAVPEGMQVSARLYAAGTQNYMWNGTTWYFIGPTADLFADAGGNGRLGIHYAGPTWVSVSGSGVVGRLVDRCDVDSGSIPWLLLSAVSSRGPGIFEGTTYIQRLNTVGGVAPTTPGTQYGEQAKVPYTAEYVFYKAQ